LAMIFIGQNFIQ